MKIIRIDYNNKIMIVSADYWEVELMGFDVLKGKDVCGTYCKNVLSRLDELVDKHFSNTFKYAVKTIIDENKGVFYYKVMPFEKRIDEFIMEEMIKNNRKWVMLGDEIWMTEI